MDPTRERKAVEAEVAAAEVLLPPSDQQQLAALVTEMRALYAELHSPKGSAWVGKLLKGLESDPNVQVKVHKWATVFWLCNMVLAMFVFFFAQGFWAHASVFYLVIVSLYANVATDYDGLSSAQAHLHSLEASEAAKKNQGESQ